MRFLSRLPLRYSIPVLMFGLVIIASMTSLAISMRLALLDEEERALSTMHHDIAVLQDMVNYRLRNGDLEGVQSAIANFSAGRTVDLILLIDDRATVIAASNIQYIGRGVTEVPETMDLKQMHATRTSYRSDTFMQDDRVHIHSYFPVIIGFKEGEIRPNRIGVIFIQYDIEFNKAVLTQQLFARNLNLLGIITAGILLMFFLLQRLLTRRVSRLVETTRALSAGDLDFRTQIDGRDELAEIGSAIDRMAVIIAGQQQRLEESERRYRSIIDTAGEGIILVDRSLTIQMLNRRMAEILATTPDRVLGRSITEFLAAEMNNAQPLWPVFSNGPALYHGEWRLLQLDGTIRWNLVAITTIMEEDANGSVYVCMFTDITERKSAEQELQQTLESTSDGVLALDADWNIIYVNTEAESMLGVAHNSVRHQNYWALFPGQLGTRLEHAMRQGAAGERTVLEVHAKDHDRWLNVRCYPRQGGGVTIFTSDISLQKSAELQTEQRMLELQRSITNMKTLGGLIPICSSCKMIRDEEGEWNVLEQYLMDHTHASFTHGMCPSCTDSYINEMTRRSGMPLKRP